MYYDVGAQQYWYPQNGAWVSSATVPQQYRDVDLHNAYIVELHKDATKPWLNHADYSQNYPPHVHEQYGSIAESNRLIPNVPPEHEVVPRAFNENTNHVTFVERPRAGAPRIPADQHNPAAGAPRVTAHEVPIQTIAPSMPAESHKYNYGGGYRGK